MYTVRYGDAWLHDPATGCVLVSASVSASASEYATCELVLPRSHPEINSVKVRDPSNPVTIADGDREVFRGFVWETRETMVGDLEVSCRSDLAYLDDTIVRPYSTVEGDAPLKAPADPAGLLQWYVNQHNLHSDASTRFRVGMNDGNLLDPNAYVMRSSTQRPTTYDEIRAKLIEPLGGVLFCRWEGGERWLDWYAECSGASSQVIDFGVNLTDYLHCDSADGMATALIPVGGTPEGTDVPITLDGMVGGEVAPGVMLEDGVVWSVAGVAAHGRIEVTYESEALTQEGLLKSAIDALGDGISPSVTIEADAVDLALLSDEWEPLAIGQYVRVRSRPHGVDRYMLVTGVDLDLSDPSHSRYTLGVPRGTYSTIMKRLDASINAQADVVAAISAEAKAAARDANEALSGSAASVEVSKEGTTTTITVTSGDGTVTSAEIEDGRDGEDGERGPQGEPGPQGDPGADGEGVSVSSVMWAPGTSGTVAPASGWQASVPAVAQGAWLWCRITYSDSTVVDTCSYMGTDGTDGTSVAIQSVTKSGATTTIVLRDASGTRTLTIKDGDDGDDGQPGAAGDDAYVHTAWANSADGTEGFSTSVSAGKSYLGVYSDHTLADSTNPADYSWSLIKGADGEDGSDGDDGRGVAAVTTWWRLLPSALGTPPAPSVREPSGWSETEPAYVGDSTKTLYRCERTDLSDGTWSWGEVSISSSYEAAKAAWNKAQAAGEAASKVAAMVHEYEDGVIVARPGQGVGALVNADGSFDVVTIAWEDGVPSATGVAGSLSESMVILLGGLLEILAENAAHDTAQIKLGNASVELMQTSESHMSDSDVDPVSQIGLWADKVLVNGKPIHAWEQIAEATGRTACTFDLTGRSELMVVARTQSYLGTATVPVAVLTDQEQELYLGGGGNGDSGDGRDFAVHVTRTSLVGVLASADGVGVENATTWTVFAR